MEDCIFCTFGGQNRQMVDSDVSTFRRETNLCVDSAISVLSTNPNYFMCSSKFPVIVIETIHTVRINCLGRGNSASSERKFLAA